MLRHQRTNTFIKDCKWAYYRSDGQGRDTYIIYNNGGMILPKKSSSLDSRSSKYQQPKTKHGGIKPSN